MPRNVRRGVCIALGLLAALELTGAAIAQGARLQLFLPAGVSSGKMEVQYVLYGPFGARGGYANPTPAQPFVEIPLSVDSGPAGEIRMFAWAPGCQIETFDVPLHALDVQATYTCTPRPDVRLAGRLAVASLPVKRRSEITIEYLAYWACSFFEEMDCSVPQISVGTSKLDPDGSFEIELPDLANDAPGAGPSCFQITLRDLKSYNVITFLSPQLTELRSPYGGLKVASSYPKATAFIVKND